MQNIERILAGSPKPFTIRVSKSTKLDDLRQGLLEFRPQFAHFVGHATKMGLMLEDNEGRPYIVNGHELAQAFQPLAGVTKCTFLNAAYTAVIAENIALSVEHVIANRHPVVDSDAAEFAETFYTQIGAGESISSSFEMARLQIELKGGNKTPPVLIYRPVTSVLPYKFNLALVEPDLVAALSEDPSLMHQLGWRSFEKALAQLLERFGYEIELQRGTKDGGIDLFALKKQGIFGPERYLVQAKKWSVPVGVEPVREIMFLHSQHRMTKSCLASTSRFTKGAWNLAAEYQWQLELRDSDKLREWIELATLR